MTELRACYHRSSGAARIDLIQLKYHKLRASIDVDCSRESFFFLLFREVRIFI